MSDSNKDSRTKTRLLEENEELRRRLEEAEQALEAIRSGEVDALVVAGPQGTQVFSLSGAEHVYRMIVETMNEAALMVDPDGTVLFCNQRFCDLMKTPIQEVMGHKMAAFVARPQQPLLRVLLAHAQARPGQQRLTLRASDGTAVPVQVSASPLQAGDRPSICLVASDLTELEESANSIRALREHEQQMQEANERLQEQSGELQSQAEELRAQTEELTATEATLRESERRYSALFANKINGMAHCRVITDEHGRPVNYWILRVNEAYERIIGIKKADIEGRRATEVFPDIRNYAFDYIGVYGKIALEGGEIKFEEFFEATGQYLSIYAYSPLPGEFAALFTDVTERKRAEEALQNANGQLQVQAEELRASEAALRDLTATLESKVAQRTAQLEKRARQLQKMTLEVSLTEDRERKRMAEILHDDLQQIIAGAKFHLNLLRNRTKHDASLQAIGLEIDQMLKDAIEKSRGLSHELSPAVLHQGDFAETLGWLARQMQAKHGLVVQVRARGQADLQSDAIKSFLYKAAQELLFNVVKHARVNEARIRFRRHGPYACLSISDRGRGFDPQGLREAAGYGLLGIRERIELLGGRMKIRSAAGQGSTFFIVVPDSPKSEDTVGVGPRAYPVPLAPGDREGKEGGHGGPPLRVLLADDHRIVREGLRLLLREEPDIEIVGEAAHGREAVDLALRLKPDVVIMDVSMPLIDGDAATRQIKEHLPQTRVIALSTYNEPETIGKMYQAGAESYVLKTAPSEELLAAIRGQTHTGLE